MNNEIKVRMVVTSERVAAEIISETLELAPSKVWRRGEPVHPKATTCYAHHGWEISCEAKGVCSISPAVQSLISMLHHDKQHSALIALMGAVEIELSVIVYFREICDIPSIGLEADDIAFLSSIGACFDLDLCPCA